MMIGGTKPQCWQQIDLAAELLFDPLCDCRHKIGVRQQWGVMPMLFHRSKRKDDNFVFICFLNITKFGQSYPHQNQ